MSRSRRKSVLGSEKEPSIGDSAILHAVQRLKPNPEDEAEAEAALLVPDPNLEVFAKRLRSTVKDSKLTIDAFADDIGVSTSALKGWLAGKFTPGLVNLLKIKEKRGVSVGWLVGEYDVTSATNPMELAEDEGFVFLPRYDVVASAGPGQVVVEENLKGVLAFSETFIRNTLRVNPAFLVLIQNAGDSMSPTIDDGDILLIDRSEENISASAIYVLLAGNELLVKRVERQFDGTVTLKSDNPRYEARTLKPHEIEHLRIFGRVRWHGGTT